MFSSNSAWSNQAANILFHDGKQLLPLFPEFQSLNVFLPSNANAKTKESAELLHKDLSYSETKRNPPCSMEFMQEEVNVMNELVSCYHRIMQKMKYYKQLDSCRVRLLCKIYSALMSTQETDIGMYFVYISVMFIYSYMTLHCVYCV